MRDFTVLSIKRKHKLLEIALERALDREALLTGIDRRIVATIPIAKDLASQIMQDLDRLADIPAKSDAPLPIGIWLENARALLDVFPERSEIVAAQREIGIEESMDSNPSEPESCSGSTLLVDPMSRNACRTIGEALQRVPLGGRILVCPGRYHESIRIDRPVYMAGAKGRDDTVVVSESTVLTFQAVNGRVSNLTIRQSGFSRKYAVVVGEGRLEVDNCDISSEGHACIRVGRDAEPFFRRCRIHGGRSGGVVFSAGARGRIEASEIEANGSAGISLMEHAAPVVSGCKIADNRGAGVLIGRDALGELYDNIISGNQLANVEVNSGAAPILRANRIHSGRSVGLWISGAAGTYQHNHVFENKAANVRVDEGADPRLSNNVIRDGRDCGVIVAGAQGHFFENEIHSNTKTNFIVSKGAEPLVKLNKIFDGKMSGVLVTEGGRGTFENNRIEGNGDAGLRVNDGGRPVVQDNTVSKNIDVAFRIGAGGGGTFIGNTTANNSGGAWHIAPEAGELDARGNQEE